MGDKSPKSKERGQKQKNTAKAEAAAAVKSKQANQSHTSSPWRRAGSSSQAGPPLRRLSRVAEQANGDHRPVFPGPGLRRSGYCSPHRGSPMVSANDANMMLKLTLMRGFSLRFASTECGSQAGKTSSVPVPISTTTWSVL
jgi:hypothetical protein